MKRFLTYLQAVLRYYRDWNGLSRSLRVLAPLGSGNRRENTVRPGLYHHHSALGHHGGLMGVFMIVAAFKVEWRKPILVYSLFEKAFMVYLVVANGSYSYSQGFKAGAAMDATVVLYTIGYFAVFGIAHQPAKPQ